MENLARDSSSAALAARSRGRRRGHASVRGLRGSKLRSSGNAPFEGVDMGSDGSSANASASPYSHRGALASDHPHVRGNNSMSSLIDAELVDEANKNAWLRGTNVATMYQPMSDQNPAHAASFSPATSTSSVSLSVPSPQPGTPWMGGYAQHAHGNQNYHMSYPTHLMHGTVANSLGLQTYPGHQEDARNNTGSSSSSAVAPPPSFDDYHRKTHSAAGHGGAMELSTQQVQWQHPAHAHHNATQTHEFAGHHQPVVNAPSSLVEYQHSTDVPRWRRDFISAQDFS